MHLPYKMIIKKKKEGAIWIYTVGPDYTDEEMVSFTNTHLRASQIKHIFKHSCDVFNEKGQLLIRFRKHSLSPHKMNMFYENIIDFAHTTSSNRGNTTGEKGVRHVRTNTRVMSNIFGFFDRWSPRQKFVFNNTGIRPAVEIRECLFNSTYPNKYKQTLPLLKEIDQRYRELAPVQYRKQRNKADETVFRIQGTAFTTVTTNINFQTTIHQDKGDDIEGIGNLVVFEKGVYTGGETCFPQYGIGVDVRHGDFMLMDVHQPHGNLPIQFNDNNAERMSVVCYLRKNVWLKTRHKPMSFLTHQRNTLKRAIQKNQEISATNAQKKTRKHVNKAN